ncbi:MAG: DNA translocase FtsK 4TM domain-containing protein, partial [Luminiphilus sp.]|nr:DNA translocase FtsK 4TM domain-containing protein [Luminiphilus sp.]
MSAKNAPSKSMKGEQDTSAPSVLASVGFIAGLAVASFSVVSLTTFDTADPGWSSSGSASSVLN